MRRVISGLLCATVLLGAGPGADYFAMKKRAFYAYEHGAPDKALKEVQAFIRSHPENLYAQNLLAVFYYWQGEKAQARTILEKIVAKGDLPEAKRLLAKLGPETSKKEGAEKSKDERAGITPKRPGDYKHEKEGRKEDDLAFMKRYIRTHPEEVEARKVLLNYYISVNDKEEAARIVQQLLRIDPDDIETLTLAKSEGIEIAEHAAATAFQDNAQRDRVVALLHKYREQKAYRRYLNLYQAFANQKAYLPLYIHLEALEVAVSLREYKVARRILLENDFPATQHLRELRALLDRKLKVHFAL